MTTSKPAENILAKEETVKKIFVVFYELVIKLLVLAAVVAVVVKAFTEVFDDRIVFRPFNVPPALREKGYEGAVMTNRVADRIDSIRRIVEKDEREKFIDISTDASNEDRAISIPGTGITLDQMTDFLRVFFGTSLITISGSAVLADEDLYLAINVSGRPAGLFSGSMKSPEALIHKAAEYIMKNIDPFTLGRFYSINRNFEAMRDLAEYIRENSKSVQERVTAHLIEGLAFFDQKLYREALYEWGIASMEEPGNIKALLYQGWALDELGRYNEAMEMYKRVIALEPGNPAAHNNWAITLYSMRNSREAVTRFEKLARIKPDYAKAYNNQGYLLYEFGEYEAGIRLVKKAIRLNSRQPYFHLNLAEGLLKLHRNKEALEPLKRALQLDNGLSKGWLLWAEALARLGRFDEAFEKYLKGKGS